MVIQRDNGRYVRGQAWERGCVENGPLKTIDFEKDDISIGIPRTFLFFELVPVKQGPDSQLFSIQNCLLYLF